MTRYLLFFLAVLALVLGACGGGDDDDVGDAGSPAASVSPMSSADGRTPAASPTEATSDGGEATEAPAARTPTPAPALPPPEPSLEGGAQKVGSGTMTFTLLPSGQFPIDPLGLLPAGTTPPACDVFVFAFTWEITSPDPPGSEQVVWETVSGEQRQQVAAGAEGEASVGCGQLFAVNRGANTLVVGLHFVQGARQG